MSAEIRAGELLARLGENPVGAEIGVYRGAMSRELLRGNAGLKLYMVDSWADTSEQPAAYIASGDTHARMGSAQQRDNLESAQRQTEPARNRRVILHMTSEQAAHEWTELLDFVFIDGDHSYEGVKKDIELWAPLLKPGGLLCGHDYNNADGLHAGVKRAVDEAAEINGWIIELGRDFTWFRT